MPATSPGSGRAIARSIETRWCGSPSASAIRSSSSRRVSTDDTVYPNGVSTSLPREVQAAFIATIPGLEHAVLRRPAMRSNMITSTRASSTRPWRQGGARLYLAGQINGTTGYEEAAAQGLIAGLNAALAASGSPSGSGPVVLDRADAYIGVLIDDLVTRGTAEPYRMFTSRAEYRLTLRADNADQRLTPLGLGVSAISGERARAFAAKTAALDGARRLTAALRLSPTALRRHGIAVNEDGVARSAAELLAYPGIDVARLAAVWPELRAIAPDIAEQLEIDARYAGYLERQARDIAAFRRDESLAIARGARLRRGRQPVGGNPRQACRVPAHHPRRRRADLGGDPAALVALLQYVKRRPEPRAA